MSEISIQISARRCKRHGLCAEVCPARVYKWEKGMVPLVANPERCTFCGQCVAVCPADCIEHSGLEYENFKKITHDAPCSLIECIRERRSVRNYREKTLSHDVLARIANSAGFAPTGAFGGNDFVRQIVIVSDPIIMRKVATFTAQYMLKLKKVLEGPLLRTMAKFFKPAQAGRSILPDLTMRLEHWKNGIDDITYNAPVAIFVHTSLSTPTPHEDTSAAMMNILLSAHTLGVGGCWNGWLAHAAISAHVKDNNELAKLLNLPDTNRVVQAATFGWPRIKLHSLPSRKTNIQWIE